MVDTFKGMGTWTLKGVDTWTLLKGWARGGHVDTFKGVGHVVDTWTLSKGWARGRHVDTFKGVGTWWTRLKGPSQPLPCFCLHLET